MRAVWKLVLVLLSITLASCWSQTVGASLQGTIYDPSGAFVAGCTVEIHNLDNGAVRTVTSDSRGRYREPLLPPGAYEVRVSLAGFRPVLFKDVRLTVGQDAVLDVRLEITAAVLSWPARRSVERWSVRR